MAGKLKAVPDWEVRGSKIREFGVGEHFKAFPQIQRP